MKKGKDGIYCRYIKRILDIICSSLAMLVFCWLYVLIAILVRIKLGSPVIFKQKRPGKIDPKTGQEKIFTLYKFRTMTDAKDSQGKLLPDDIRLTKFGKLLRSTSLDELPEAWNILKGDMSVIGPRPLLVKYLPYYTEVEHHRHDVRPGLSGLAQVNGRNALEWEERFEIDVYYTQNVGICMDLSIIWSSIISALSRENIIIGKQHVFKDLDEERKASGLLPLDH